MFSKARIPYGTWGCSYFPSWQTSELAQVNIAQFAAEGMNKILSLRGVQLKVLDHLITGSTVPWHWKFWNSPMLSACLGKRVPGYHVEQACATGLQAILLAATEVDCGAQNVVGVLTFDRTSDSPVGVFPERRSHRRTEALADVWDNFSFDPATGTSMIAAAGNVARKYKLDKSEVDEMAALRYEQYFKAIESGFINRYAVPLEILNIAGRPLDVIDSDKGVRRLTHAAISKMREFDTCVTGGTQTHAADGMATLLVATKERAKQLSTRPEIDIQFVAKTEIRTQPSLMPEAPAIAVKKLLQQTGMKLDDMATVKSHNPFGVNDVAFSKILDYDWRKMNNNGCSLVWGHPQGPTLTRLVIEGLEETVDLGGGYLLIEGCAAGDVGIAAIFKISEGGK